MFKILRQYHKIFPRKFGNYWKKIENAINIFFDKPKEATINSIDKAFSKYVTEVYEGIVLTDYISLINKKPNEAISKQELFTDYKTWFHNLTEIKNLKKKKTFKDKTKDEKETERFSHHKTHSDQSL